MSHFTVLVIGNDVKKQLEPYAEQDFDQKYGQFENKEEEYKQEFKTGTIEAAEIKGQLYYKYSSEFRNYDKGLLNDEYRYPEGTIFKKVSFEEFYSTFEKFLSDYHGVHEPDDTTGLYGYWNNPNAKWDWWVVGGRWTGYFKPKAGASGTLGRSGAFGNQPDNGWVDVIKYGDVDFEAMKNHEAKQANEHFDKIEAIVQGMDIPHWATIREKHGDDIDAARNEYNSHPIIKGFNQAGFYHFGTEPSEEYGQGREVYVEKCRNQTAVPYAILKDGVWYQKGEMGWFGMSSNEMTQDEWNSEFWKLLDTLDPDTLLTLVDCHI